MDILSLLAGLVIGIALGWLIAKRSAGPSRSELEQKYVPKSVYEQARGDLKENEDKLVKITTENARWQSQAEHMESRLKESKAEFEELRARMAADFENLSNRIFEEKSRKFVEMNHEKVSDILNPLKEKIKSFEEKVDKTYGEEMKERVSLKKELESIVRLNQQVSDDATRLTQALKGDKKLQGDWGEFQLEQILIHAGLEKGVHYLAQESYSDENGRQLRPDFVINLPEEKNIVIDSKVSLVAYEQYFHAEDDSDREQYLKQHVTAIQNHISSLSAKNYSQIYGINSPDYVIMFVPLEPALYAALKQDGGLFEKALTRNIVLASASTILATLRVISFVWKQENQRRNVAEIARQSGALYDKFVGFFEDLENIGSKISALDKDYQAARNKLFDSPQKGTTIIGRIEQIKKLGAQTGKSLPRAALDSLDE